MKAVRIHEYGSFEKLSYVEVDIPEPLDGQVLIRTESISINFADTMVRKGNYHIKRTLPVVPGFEASGYVEKVAPGLEDLFSPGERVLYVGSNCYAEYITAESESVFHLPESIDMDEAAVMPVTYLTAYHMMFTTGHLRPGNTVLSYAAAGGVGTAVAQIGKIYGIRTIGLTSSPSKATFAREKGFDRVIDYKSENVVRRVMEITGGRGAELILNGTAGSTLDDDFRMASPLGQIIWFGMAGGPPSTNLLRRLALTFGKGVAIRPFHLMTSVAGPFPDLFNESMRIMLGHLAEGRIKPHIHARFHLRDAGKAHELLESREVLGKLILKP